MFCTQLAVRLVSFLVPIQVKREDRHIPALGLRAVDHPRLTDRFSCPDRHCKSATRLPPRPDTSHLGGEPTYDLCTELITLPLQKQRIVGLHPEHKGTQKQ